MGARTCRAFRANPQFEWLALSYSQLVEQGLGLFQIERVEAFGEPSVDRSEKIAGLIPLALIAPEAGHAHRRAEFKYWRLLVAGDHIRLRKGLFRRNHVGGVNLDISSPRNRCASASNERCPVCSIKASCAFSVAKLASVWPELDSSSASKIEKCFERTDTACVH